MAANSSSTLGNVGATNVKTDKKTDKAGLLKIKLPSCTYSFNTFKNSEEFSDCIVCVEDQNFHCHKIILTAASPYFAAMFRCAMREANESRAYLNGISSYTFNTLLDFIYRQESEVHKDNIEDLFMAANMLQISDVQQACSSHLVSILNDANCCRLLQVAETLHCEELEHAAKVYVIEHLLRIAKCCHRSLSALPLSTFTDIIKSDALLVREGDIYKIVCCWIEADSSRHSQAEQIFQHVRFSLMPQRFIACMVMKNPVFEENRECAAYLQADMAYRYSPQHKLSNMPPQLALRRNSDMHDYAFCIAATNVNHRFQVFALDMNDTSVDERSQSWISLFEYTSTQTPLFIGRVGEALFVFTRHYSGTNIKLLKINLRTKAKSNVDCQNQELNHTCCMVTDEVDKLYFLCIPGSQGLVMNGCKILQYSIESKNLQLLATISDKFNGAPKVVTYNTELYVFGIKVDSRESYLVAYKITDIDSAHPTVELVTTDLICRPWRISTVTVLGNTAVIQMDNNTNLPSEMEDSVKRAGMYQFGFEEDSHFFLPMTSLTILTSTGTFKACVAYKGFLFYFDTSLNIQRYTPKTGWFHKLRGTTISGNCRAITSVARLPMIFN